MDFVLAASEFGDLWQIQNPWWHLVLRGGILYLALLVMMRISGKRQVGQMGIGQLVAVLLLTHAIEDGLSGGDDSITAALIVAGTILLLSFLVEVMTYHSPRVESLLQGRPTLLIHRGQVLHEQLRRELLSLSELQSLLRKQGVHDLTDLEEAILESDGYISIRRKVTDQGPPEAAEEHREF